MKYILTILVLFTFNISWGNYESVDCGTMGPRKDNLSVYFEFFNPSSRNEVIFVGYELIGFFQKFEARGCSNIYALSNSLYCDGVTVGTLGEVEFVSDDISFPGSRAKIELSGQLHSVEGSCSNARNPLTINFLIN